MPENSFSSLFIYLEYSLCLRPQNLVKYLNTHTPDFIKYFYCGTYVKKEQSRKPKRKNTHTKSR